MRPVHIAQLQHLGHSRRAAQAQFAFNAVRAVDRHQQDKVVEPVLRFMHDQSQVMVGVILMLSPLLVIVYGPSEKRSAHTSFPLVRCLM